MRRFITRVALFVILINILPSALWARTANGVLRGGRSDGWITKAVHAIRELSSSPNFLTSDEGLETEGGPDFGGPDVPVDGGVSLLLAAGAAYGLRKLRAKRK